MRRIGPISFFVPLHPLQHAQTLIEIQQIDAAPHGDVLAVVENFSSARVHKAGGATTQFTACFKHNWSEAGLGQAQRGGNARNAPANNRHSFHLWLLGCSP